MVSQYPQSAAEVIDWLNSRHAIVNVQTPAERLPMEIVVRFGHIHAEEGCVQNRWGERCQIGVVE